MLLSRPSDSGHTPFGDIYISESPDMEYWGHHRHLMRWFYHKNHAIIGIVAAFISAYFIWQTASFVPIDYTVAWVGSRELDSDEANIISEQIARYGEDLNDDGKVHVSLHQI